MDFWPSYQHFSLDFLDFPCDTNTMNIVLNALTAFTSCNFSLRLQEVSDAVMPPSLQSRCRLGNLRQQSDKLRNKQPSPPFVQCSHPQLGSNTNCQKSEHFRRGPRFSQR